MNAFILDFPLRFAICLCLLCLCLAPMATDAEEVGAIWTTPVQIDGSSVLLPKPSMSDSLDADQQEAVLKDVAGKYPLDRFLKDSIVAPFQLHRESIKRQDGERIGHRVDVWFIAHGSLAAIRDQDLFTEMLDKGNAGVAHSGQSGSGQSLTADELSARGLVLEPTGGLEQGYYRFAVGVIDRVLVQGVILGTSQSTELSQFASVRLDDRFSGDKEYPNQWRQMVAKSEEAVPYSGLAAYAKATRLLGHGDAIFVECHAVLHEPTDWFQGPNLLSSKLPLATQDAVRKFRRALSKD